MLFGVLGNKADIGRNIQMGGGMTQGNDWQKKSFRVFMSTGEKKINKCFRCRKQKTHACHSCKRYSKFEDRGFVFIDRRGEK